MKKSLLTIWIALFSIVVIVASCKKEYSCEGCNIGNKPPIAVAGTDHVITLPTDSLMLNGSLSYDTDGTITAWNWTKIEGPASIQIMHLDSPSTVIKMLVQGQYKVELMVTDDKGLSAKDTVLITVNPMVITNQPPVACAGPDQTITLPVNSCC